MAHWLKAESKMACPACGAGNRLGAFVCTRCGSRIYGDGKNPPRIHSKTVGGPRPALRNTLISALGVIVGVALLLAIWPFPPVGDSQGRVEEVESAWTLIERQLQAGEAVSPHVLREGALNRFFAEKNITGKNIKVEVASGRLLLIANEAIGPFTLGTRVVIVSDKPRGTVAAQSAWVGHLPLPRALARGLVKGVARRFHFPVPESIWTQLTVLRMDPGSVMVGAPVAAEVR